MELRFDKHAYVLRDLWAQKDIGTTGKNLKAMLPPHDVLMLRLEK